MPIVGGLDIHRAQITFDYLDLRTGEETRGTIRPATREVFRQWLGQFGRKQVAFAMEGTTGWRFVVEELEAAGMEAHLAEPSETRARRGPKRRAKTDRADARLLRDLLLTDNLPESWIPPAHLADLRTTVRLRKALVDARSGWNRRIQAQLFHHGLPSAPHLQTLIGRQYVSTVDLPAAGRQVVEVGLRMLEVFDEEIESSTTSSSISPAASSAARCCSASGAWGRSPQPPSWPNSGTLGASRAPGNRCASRGSMSPLRSPMASGPEAISPAKALQCCAGPSMRSPPTPGAKPRRTMSTTSR